MSNFSTFEDEIFISDVGPAFPRSPLPQGPPPSRVPHLQNPAASRSLDALCIATFLDPGLHRALAEDRLDINVRKRSQVQVVQLRGPLRMGAAVDSLRQTLEESVANGDNRLVLNLAEVAMIDSSGIGLLVRFLASTKQRGGNIKLVQPSKFAVQTLRLVGVLNLFEIFDDDDAAAESFV